MEFWSRILNLTHFYTPSKRSSACGFILLDLYIYVHLNYLKNELSIPLCLFAC